jgi:hypothetical protein
MVLDAPQIASRLARLHGGRSTSLLLVDGMRFDLTRRVQRAVADGLAARATQLEDYLLWSALPTTTIRQLETIARGLEALRTPADVEPDIEPSRDRTADYVRRLRVGPRELHKLDLVENRLRAARDGVLKALPQIAEDVAGVVVRHAQSLAPRTLLFVFGDHGFTVDQKGYARHGGASPEEVLVGSFAVLTSDAP